MAAADAVSSFTFTGIFHFQSVCLFLLVLVVILKFLRSPRNLPPGPRRWPVVGNIPSLLRSQKHTHEVLADWAQRYGSVMTVGLQAGRAPGVVLSDIDTVKEALLKQGERFANRYVPFIFEKVFTVDGSYSWENGDASKVYRRFGLGALRSLGVGTKSLELKINEEIRYLIDYIAAKKSRPFDPLLLALNAVSNIICIISFGYRFHYADPKFSKLLIVLKTLFDTSGLKAIGNVIPPLVYTPIYSKSRALVEYVKQFIMGIIQEHKDSYDPNNFRDIIDLYINETKQRERDGTGGLAGRAEVFTDQHIWRGIVDLFGAGTHTTTTTLLWIIALMLKYPGIQDKIQKEISDVIGGDRQPSCEDRPNMPYTNAVIMEVQRHRSATPTAVPYKTSQEAQLLGYTIPKNTLVLVNLWAVMHDPKVWERPDEFDPGRFLTEDGKKLVNHEAFIPFGIGGRSCLGENLAKMKLFLFVTNLFQRFTFKLPAGASPPSLAGVGGVLFVPEPFKICAFRR